MGKGRAPCCDKNQVKRGPWSPAEDLKLIAFVQKYGHENWRALPKQAGLQRCGKSCRLRWINYLRPDVKRGNFTIEEEETIIRLHKAMGNKWSKIASCLPGRTDNEIKNVWNTHIKKRFTAVAKNSESSADESKLESSITSYSPSTSSESFLSNARPNLPKTTTPPGSEFNEQTSQVTMTDQIEKDSEMQLIGITENPKGSSNSTSLSSSVESDMLNSSQIVTNKPEQQQLASPLTFLGPFDVDNVLEEVDKPNHNLFEIPWESDYDLWKFFDNVGSFHDQSNEVQQLGGEFPASDQNHNVGGENQSVVQDVESMKWSHDFVNEFGVVGETKESNNDQLVLPKNYAVEPEIDPRHLHQAFDFNDMMTRPESELDLGYIQLWPTS